jgi:hypothetical protein
MDAILAVLLIVAGSVIAGTVALFVVAAIATVMCYGAITGYHLVAWILQTPQRRREQRRLEELRWRTWRPKQDLRLPH